MLSIKKKFFAKGRRSIVYTGLLGKKVVAVKIARKDIAVKHHISNEARFLKLLNKHGIGPKLIKAGNDYIIYEFVEGTPLVEWIKTASTEERKRILKAILQQCRTLDLLQIDKREMHHPIKHIFVKKKPVMIDFERCRKVKNPKNVTQFAQFLMNHQLLKKDIPLLQVYKSKHDAKTFMKIITLLT